jgi:NAD(P) transhydrogenase subunit alpha
MRVGVPKESAEGERRVALVPDAVTTLGKSEVEVVIESGAGEGSGHPDGEYADAGATVGSADDAWGAEVVVHVAVPTLEEIGRLRSGQVLVGFLAPLTSGETTRALAEGGVTSLAMEAIPRITRAQAMDALSSQANVAGYAATLLAAREAGRFFPMMTTAAGTVAPAKVLVLGAGVAGLQAIATAKRLGAVVKAYDVRAAAAEEIRSMGAVAIELELETLEGAGGYAREMTQDRAARQRELLAPYIADADALITTAAVPGRQAPLLVTAEMVEQMRPGSVVVDLAAESGGNVEGALPGQVVRLGHAQVWGGANVPAQMPGPASRLYAQNVVNLVTLMTREGAFAPDFDDEIVAGSCVTHDGAVRHEPTRTALEGEPA